MIAGPSEAPPAAVPSAPRIRSRFLIALALTNIVLIVWATAQLSAAVSTAPVPTNRVEPPSVAIAAPASLRAPPDTLRQRRAGRTLEVKPEAPPRRRARTAPARGRT